MSCWEGVNRPGVSLTDLVARVRALEDRLDSMICCEDCEHYCSRSSAHDMDHGIYYCDPCFRRRVNERVGF